MTDTDPREHYAVMVTDLPPTEVVCRCGERFDEGDVLAALKAHMDAPNSHEAE